LNNSFAAKLLAWYDRSARVMPWRSNPSPYHTWVSEIMLQQTQVATVIPYFERWVERFPTLESLAEAELEEVLIMWEGLGYYSRARNLHKAARLVVSEHSGELPADSKALIKLPGIGRYTAGAILSIAFNQRQPALDGNIRRVYTRLLDSNEPIRTPQSEKLLWDFAERSLPHARPGDFNQALMDLGATICLPQAPECARCPLQDDCLAFQHGAQNDLPVKVKKSAIPHLIVGAGVVRSNSKVLIARRPPRGLLGSLWEFPGGKLEASDQDIRACIRRELIEELNLKVTVNELVGIYSHAYTHFKVTVHAYFCEPEAGERIVETADLKWAAPAELDAYAMGKVDRRIAKQLIFAPGGSNKNT